MIPEDEDLYDEDELDDKFDADLPEAPDEHLPNDSFHPT